MDHLVHQQAYNALRDMIRSYTLMPGQRVSDFSLAKKLGFSRTPVREALASLSRDGLVVTGEKGYIVRPLDADDLKDLCYLREALESMALHLIMERGGFSPEELAKLKELNRTIERYNDEGKIFNTFEIDEKFHDFIMRSSNSPRLSEQLRIAQLQMRRYRFLTLITAGRSQNSAIEHARLIDALEAGSLSDAVETIHDHLRVTVELYTDVLQRMSVEEWVRLIRTLAPPETLQAINLF